MKYVVQAYISDGTRLEIKEKKLSDLGWEHLIAYHEINEKVSTNSDIITFTWSIPAVGISNCWYPNCQYNRTYRGDWQTSIKTMTAVSAPMYSLYDTNGHNCHTMAVSEVTREIDINCGIHEEDGTFIFFVYVPWLKSDIEKQQKDIKLCTYNQKVPYYLAIQYIRQWWETGCGITPLSVPDCAYMPFYSTWYSYHQNITRQALEVECRQAAKLGFKGIIVDDGWQTDDNNRGYAYCGDWKVAECKFPDMKEHVANVQGMGMKYILWLSVPFMGKKAYSFNQFSDKLLDYKEDLQAGVLDVRYPEVRTYLIRIYRHLVEEYKIDGLKLDFIDEFYRRKTSPDFTEGMDFKDVQDALDCFLTQVKLELSLLNSEILIEFRQRYVGPNMRKYGNIFRVMDCPLSEEANRVGIVDLRLMSGNTAVHSDMIMWNEQESVENASLQIVNCLFGTLQLSVVLSNCGYLHTKMIEHFLRFMKKHKELLLKTTLRPQEPQFLYPLIEASNDTESIVGVYAVDKVVRINTGLLRTIIVNGTRKEKIIVHSESAAVANVGCYNCCGDTVWQGNAEQIVAYNEYQVPVGGYIQLELRGGR